MGAIAFHATKAWRLSYRTSLILFLATGLGTVLAVAYEDQWGFSNGRAGLPPLYYSSNYVGDNLFAVLVASHFVFCGLFSKHLTKNLEPYKIVRFVRWMASHTFSLYVYHMPLLFFIRAIGKVRPKRDLFAVLGAMSIALLIIAGLSKITEERYPALRILLRLWFNTFTGKLQPMANTSKLPTHTKKN